MLWFKGGGLPADRVGEHREGDPALALSRPAAEHPQATAPGPRGHLAKQPCLTDTRVADQLDGSRLAAADFRECLFHAGQFRSPPDQQASLLPCRAHGRMVVHAVPQRQGSKAADCRSAVKASRPCRSYRRSSPAAPTGSRVRLVPLEVVIEHEALAHTSEWWRRR